MFTVPGIPMEKNVTCRVARETWIYEVFKGYSTADHLFGKI
jgi:hypothetical protein